METDGPAAEERSVAASSSATRRTGWVAVGVLALLAVVCCKPLVNEGWFTSHEKIRPLARALAAYYEIAAGDLYPRWLSTGYLGKGIPLFNYYPPAFSLLVAYAHAAGVPLLLAAKLTILALFFLGSLGVYLWVRPHLGHSPALVAGILYLFAPYHFVDLYVRGATAEFTSLAALPFVFLAIDRLVERLSVRGLALLACASASVVLSHFLGAVMIAPFAAVYALVRVVQAGGGRAAVGRILAAAALGAALSAFYWLPSIAEWDALSPDRAGRAFVGYYSPFVHFVHPAQWLDPGWGFGPSLPDPLADEMSFQVGLLLLAAVALSVLLAPLLGKTQRRFVLVALGLGAAALALTTSVTRPLYAAVPPLALVQFPWRFLGPATLFLSAAGAGFVHLFAMRHRWVGPGLAAAMAAAAVAVSASQRTVEQQLPVFDDRTIAATVAADPWSASFGNEDEYLPRHATIEAASVVPGGPVPGGLGVEIGAVRASGTTDVTFEVASPFGDGFAVVPWYVFPGWEVTLDGREWPFGPQPEGLVAFFVPQGRHVARVRFGTTPPRIAGWALALAGALVLGALAIRERSLRRRRPSALRG